MIKNNKVDSLADDRIDKTNEILTKSKKIKNC